MLFRASDRGNDQRALAQIERDPSGSSMAHRRGLAGHARTLNWLAVCCMVAVIPADAAMASKHKPLAASKQQAAAPAKRTAKATPAIASRQQSRASRAKNRHAARGSHRAAKVVPKAPPPPTI